MTSFRIAGLDPSLFEPLFSLSPEELARRGIRRVVAPSSRGYPCRVGLRDAAEGEELLLLPYEHQSGHSPYRASGPIYVCIGAKPGSVAVGVVPEYVSRRQISVRGYDAAHMMVRAEVCDGEATAAEIERQFEDPSVSYIHLHNAKRGCYSCQVQRAEPPARAS